MSNWAKDFLAANPDKALLLITRHRHGITFTRPDGLKESNFTGLPVHYEETPGNWQPIDTALVDDGTFLHGIGTPAKIRKSTGAVENAHSSQRPSRIVRYRPSNDSVAMFSTIPKDGTVDGENHIRAWAEYTFNTRIYEAGVRQELTIATLPTLTGGAAPTDYIMVEEELPNSTLPDGWLDEGYWEEGFYHPAPVAWDSALSVLDRHNIPTRRLVRTSGNSRWILTGVAVSDLASATYPVVIDPDYADTTADGWVWGENLSTNYAAARATSSASNSSVSLSVGQENPGGTEYKITRSFLKFNTSAIPDGDTVTQDNLKMTCTSDSSGTDFDVQIVKQNWSAQDALSDANREAAYDNCLAGTADSSIWRNTNGMSLNTQYASGNLATAWVNKAGYTYYSLRSSLDYDNTTPTGIELVYLASQEHATAGYRPVLTVLHETSNTAPTITAGPTTTYASGSDTRPSNTWGVTFTPDDTEQTAANALTYYVALSSVFATAVTTHLGTGTCTADTEKVLTGFAYDATGLVQGNNTVYLHLYDGALNTVTAGSCTVAVEHVQAATGGWVVPFPVLAGTGKQIDKGSGALVVPFPVLAATGAQTAKGTGALVVPFPAIAATGMGPGPKLGTGAFVVPFPVMAATGVEQPKGIGGLVVPFPVLSAAGVQALLGVGGLVVPFPVLSATGKEVFKGSGAFVVPFPVLAGVGAQVFKSTGAWVVPFPLLSATGEKVYEATGALVVPFLVLAGTGGIPPKGTGVWVVPFPVFAAIGVAPLSGTGVWVVPFPVFAAIGHYMNTAGWPRPQRGVGRFHGPRPGAGR